MSKQISRREFLSIFGNFIFSPYIFQILRLTTEVTKDHNNERAQQCKKSPLEKKEEGVISFNQLPRDIVYVSTHLDLTKPKNLALVKSCYEDVMAYNRERAGEERSMSIAG